jgi:hypothetical protein
MMTLQYSELALSGNGWNLDAALKNFQELKASGSGLLNEYLLIVCLDSGTTPPRCLSSRSPRALNTYNNPPRATIDSDFSGKAILGLLQLFCCDLMNAWLGEMALVYLTLFPISNSLYYKEYKTTKTCQ